MEGGIAIVLISAAMFFGCFLLGLIPLLIKLSEQKLHFVTVLGAGLLCGTALAIIIPEGVELLQESWRAPSCSLALANNNSNPKGPEPLPVKGPPARFFIGLSLVVGFTLMFAVDQIGNYCSRHDPQTGMSSSTSITATLGLVMHAAVHKGSLWNFQEEVSIHAIFGARPTDGVALGAAVASSEVTVQVIVFLAVILHKAPAAFGLVSFLMHAGLEKKQIQKHLLAFSAAAPVLAVSTYFILTATGGSSRHHLSATGIGMLFSAGTFLYVATVHVLPEISSRGQQRGPQQNRTGSYQHGGGLGVMESLTLILGAGLPVLLALGLHDD